MTDWEELLEQHDATRRWLARQPHRLPVVDEEAELEMLRRLSEPPTLEDWEALLGVPPRARHPEPDW